MCEKFVPGRFFRYASYFESVLYGKIGGGFRCEHCSFQLWVQWCCGLCKYIVWHMEISIFTCIYLNFQKLCAKIQYFQRTLQAKLNTLKESCTFKGKCAVNAEIFICSCVLYLIGSGRTSLTAPGESYSLDPPPPRSPGMSS